MIKDKALRDALPKLYSSSNFKKWKSSVLDYLETKSLAFHLNFRVMKPIKLASLEEAQARHVADAEDIDWIFPEQAVDRIPAVQFRLNEIIPQA